ncbi:ATP-dependent DNA helicase PIF1, partial [Metarhizium majus ARSEF 297]
MHSCLRCKERWFDMKRNSLSICSRCISGDRKRASDEPYFFSAANNLDFGEVPNNLPDLTMVEEMLIARVHVHVKVLQARGAQYTYRGHVVHFLRNVGKLFQDLPVLPENLDIVLLRASTMDGDPRLQQQFVRNFRVRRSCLLIWLRYLQHHHQGYREIVVHEDLLQRLPVDGSIVDSITTQVADKPDSEAPQGPVEEAAEEDPSDADASAIPNLQFTETELNALQSRILNDTPDRELATDLEQMPRSAQNQHQMPFPSIRRTPINEFNHSQPLLSLAFPTLYADFVEPRLRTITYQDYLAHAMRWRDGRFARHKTWPFVAFNALLRAQLSTTLPGLRAHKLPTLAWWKMIFVRPAVLLLPGELPFTRERANVVSFSEAATARWPLFHFFAGFIKLAHCVVGMNACLALLVPSSWRRGKARIQGQNIICNLVFLNTLRHPARLGTGRLQPDVGVLAEAGRATLCNSSSLCGTTSPMWSWSTIWPHSLDDTHYGSAIEKAGR